MALNREGYLLNNSLDIVVIGVNIRSSHNVGSILRTCDGFGIQKFIAVGTTPHPEVEDDQRLPHVKLKASKQIAKTALGAESTVKVEYYPDLNSVATKLKSDGFELLFLEQAPESIKLNEFTAESSRVALFLGPEVTGFDPQVLSLADEILEIPMSGEKESFNVSVVAGIALYQLKAL